MTIPFAPIPVSSQEGANIAYELELVPAGSEVLRPVKVEVLDTGTGALLFRMEGDALTALYHPASVPPPTAEDLWNGTSKLVNPRISIWFVMPRDAVPDRLVHRVTLDRSAAGRDPLTVEGGAVAVRKDEGPVVIGLPVQGPGWTAMETTSPNTHHFDAQITLGGVTRVPQRYAQDWVYIDPETRQVASGNASLAKNYFGYGKGIYAVSDGTIVDVLDGLPDVETIYSPRNVTIATAPGNYVIQDIGGGRYACYAHMVPGSVQVRAGDAVKEGQLLGRMGNSGNSDLPHLHFQVVTGAPMFLGGEGYPHVYRSFEVIGKVNETRIMEIATRPGITMEELWGDTSAFSTIFDDPVPGEKMLPSNWDIIRSG
jgi:hypothetical protein